MTKLSDSELKVMAIIWEFEPCSAKFVSQKLEEQVGWNINTTYTTIKSCIKKGAVQRTDPNFICPALVSKDSVAISKTEDLVDKLYHGATELLFASMIKNKKLTPEQLESLRKMIDEIDE